jgi:hypothetical protein
LPRVSLTGVSIDLYGPAFESAGEGVTVPWSSKPGYADQNWGQHAILGVSGIGKTFKFSSVLGNQLTLTKVPILQHLCAVQVLSMSIRRSHASLLASYLPQNPGLASRNGSVLDIASSYP